MGMHASASGTPDACSVLVLGMDRAEEASLLQRFESLGGARVRFSASDDFDRCQVLVAHRDSAMLRVAEKLAAARAGLVFLTIDAAGELRDGRHATARAFDEHALRGLLSLERATAPPAPRDDDAGVPLAQGLHDCMATTRQQALALDGQRVLLIDFDRRLALPVGIPVDAMTACLADAFGRLRLMPLAADEFNAQLAEVPSLPVAPLLWNVALQATGGAALLPPITSESVLSLRQWPDFRALAHRHDHFRLCCLLLKRASTAQEAAHLLSLDSAVVDGFCSAAYLSGCAEIVGTRAVQPSASTIAGQASSGSALARMWRTVRQAVGA